MKIKIINVAILLVTLVGTLVFLSTLPDIIPVHFDIHGVADRWGSKYELLIMPGCMLAMLLFWFGSDVRYKKTIENLTDEKKIVEARSNQKVIEFTSVITSFMFAVINALILYASYSQLDSTDIKEIDFLKLLSIVMGISFILLGNFLPRAKNNSTVGLRLGFNRFNDITWRKSNLVGGVAMVVQGIIMILSGIIFRGTVAMIIMLITLAVVLPAITIYAYVIYRQEKDKNNE